IDWRTGKNKTVHRDRKFDVTDVWLEPDGTAYLAGIQIAGELRGVLPGKVQVFQSRDADLSVWASIPVDYRAVAHRAFLAGTDQHNLWMATDNGMILKLEK